MKKIKNKEIYNYKPMFSYLQQGLKDMYTTLICWRISGKQMNQTCMDMLNVDTKIVLLPVFMEHSGSANRG